MPVELICVALQDGDPMVAVDSVEVVAGAGIVGDRKFGAKQRHPGQNITLVEAEEIERFNQLNNCAIPLISTRRNLVTRGVRLNDLVGVVFKVGEVRMRGVELCEPCQSLTGYFADTQLPPSDFIRAFAHRCGLRADVLDSGVICTGSEVRRDAQAER
jgi:MOSC domain-containing protein YiiM